MSGRHPDLTTRVATGLAGAAAAFAARKVLHAGWKQVTGREPPESPEDPQVSLGEALTWVVLTGVLTGMLRLIATRYAAGALAKSGAPAAIKARINRVKQA